MAKCARADCGKTVYPMEELKCLDQVWHKQCFRCGTCNMVLNLKNYKGYNKVPYCEAHYPKTTATVVADTPEMRRLQENTKLQSQVKYHEEFERMKGKKLDVVDDPELQRHMKNSMIQSNVAYHHEGERKDQMEKVRPPLEETGQINQKGSAPPASAPAPATAPPGATPTPISATKAAQALHQQQASSSPARAGEPAGKPTTPYSAKTQQSPTLIYSSEQGGRVQPPNRAVGSIADYDPLNGQWGSIASMAANRPNQPTAGPGQKQSPTGQKQSPTTSNYPGYPQERQPPGQTHSPSPLAPKHSPTSPGRITNQKQQASPGRPGATVQGIAYRAMYDYTAADSDEISFKEGDVIMNCQQVDKGWMTGTVQRTGQWGMLPANYVERVH